MTISVLLSSPQLGENIGSVARAMLTCGLTDLRLIAPRDGWPNPAALPTAAGAVAVLEQAQVYDSTAAACADHHQIYALTARPRDLIKRVVTPRQGAPEIVAARQDGQRVGILFGSERTGLTNEEIALATAIITIPVNPDFSSLNLSHAVMVMAYELYQAAEAPTPAALQMGDTRPATHQEVAQLITHLQTQVRRGLPPSARLEAMLLNLANLFHRCQLTYQDVQSLYRLVQVLKDQAEEGEGPVCL